MRMSPMMLAHTRLLVPNTLPIRREAESSAASVVMPETKTVKYKYLRIKALREEIAFIIPSRKIKSIPQISRIYADFSSCFFKPSCPWCPRSGREPDGAGAVQADGSAGREHGAHRFLYFQWR